MILLNSQMKECLTGSKIPGIAGLNFFHQLRQLRQHCTASYEIKAMLLLSQICTRIHKSAFPMYSHPIAFFRGSCSKLSRNSSQLVKLCTDKSMNITTFDKTFARL